MKKFFLFISVLLLSIFSMFSQEPTLVKVGFSLGDASSPRWEMDKKYFEQVIRQMGHEVEFTSLLNGETLNQLDNVKSLINNGIDILVIVAANSDSAAKIVDYANSKNIKVIAYDRLINNCDLDLFISYDSKKVGEYQAKYISDKLQPGNYMIIGGPISDHNSLLIRQGQMSVLAPLEDSNKVSIIFNELAPTWAYQSAYDYTKSFLDTSKVKPDAILAGNDELAQGALKVLEEKNLKGKVLVAGQDADLVACKEIISGNQEMTVYKPIKTLAYNAAFAAINMANKKPVTEATVTVNNGMKMVPAQILVPYVVNKDNIVTNIVEDGHFTKEQLFPEGK